ncbi:MAG: hypothetical protein JWM80_3524 [Cyanobacteria bacterium RYN_339]|nr:hypothetical protein [Cyanobacteria bacterium RYN_339]
MQVSPLASRVLAPAAAAPAAADPALGNNADLVDVLKLRMSAVGDLPGGSALKLATALDSGLDADDAYDMASAANAALAAIAPALNETLLGAGLNAMMLGSGGKELKAQHQALKASMDTYKQAPDGDHVDAALGVAAAATKLTVMYRTAVNAGSAVVKYALKAVGKVPALAGDAASIGRAAAQVVDSPVGVGLRFVNKWIPLLNATWTLMAFRTAYQVFGDHKASHTSRTLACLNIGASVGVLLAGIWAGMPAFLATVAVGLLFDMGLAGSRQVDAAGGQMDAQMAAAAADPVAGLQAFGSWLVRLGRAMFRQQAQKTGDAVDRLTPKRRVPVAKDRVLVG